MLHTVSLLLPTRFGRVEPTVSHGLTHHTESAWRNR